jgi:integrase
MRMFEELVAYKSVLNKESSPSARNYAYYIGVVEQYFIDTEQEHIDKSSLAGFRDYLKLNGYAPSTIKTYVLVLKRFVQWLVRNQKLPVAIWVEMNKSPLRSDAQKLLEYFKIARPDDPYYMRDRAIVALFLGTQLSLSTLLSLEKQELDKNDLLVSDETLAIVGEYLACRTDDSPYLFISHSPGARKDKPLYRQGFYRSLNAVTDKLNISITLYTLRGD